jgi:hypothetical protein
MHNLKGAELLLYTCGDRWLSFVFLAGEGDASESESVPSASSKKSSMSSSTADSSSLLPEEDACPCFVTLAGLCIPAAFRISRPKLELPTFSLLESISEMLEETVFLSFCHVLRTQAFATSEDHNLHFKTNMT